MLDKSQLSTGFRLRKLEPADSLEELTELLHRAYKRLADMGFRYVATYQDVETTRRRVGTGECYVGTLKGTLVSTVTLVPHFRADGSSWFDRDGVANFKQFAVEPELQGLGIGSAMLEIIENKAAEMGAEELALDTAEGAVHLIDYYTKRGYRFIEYVDWDITNYRSVILSKHL
ncbi:MAG: GNAT family N-acetyltransferase [Planctomycetota bacterium]|jgi:GNAT superfamily N-acetyltransferase